MSEDNRFNVIYHDLPDEKRNLIWDMKNTAKELSEFILKNPNRDSSVAMTNLETAMMWAIKGVCSGHVSE